MKFSAFYGTRSIITVLAITPLVPILGQMSAVQIHLISKEQF
jgi:hypothetical protein